MTPFRASPSITETWQHFDFAVSDGVATLTFDRPDKLNALTFDVYADLRDLLAELPHRGDARVLVVTGAGRGFCSGGDVDEIIGELQRMETADLLEFTRMTGAVVKALRECPLPVIAAINGIAAGAGSVIALASDFRLLARSASFAFLFTRVGLSGADMGSAYLLPRIVGLGRATELLVLGDKVSAEQAERIGLATQVVDDDELPAVAQAPRAAPGRRARAGLLGDEGHAHPRARHEPRRRHRDGGVDAGAAHAQPRPRRVLRRVERGPQAGVERAMSNEIVTAPELAPPVGYAHAVIGAPGGRTVYLGGQTAPGRRRRDPRRDARRAVRRRRRQRRRGAAGRRRRARGHRADARLRHRRRGVQGVTARSRRRLEAPLRAPVPSDRPAGRERAVRRAARVELVATAVIA